MKGLTDIEGLRVGHASDYEGLTGCTVILCEKGAVPGFDIRGSATGTQEFDVMTPRHVTDRVHAVVLAGGSAFGLEAASGVRRFLEQKGVGFRTGAARVLIGSVASRVAAIAPCPVMTVPGKSMSKQEGGES